MVRSMEELAALMMDFYRHGRRLLLLFDYDGTLVPLAAHPRQAVMPQRTRHLLERLIGRSRINLGVLSGRELGQLRGLVALRNIYYAGTSGLELDLRGTHVTHPGLQDAFPALTALSGVLQKAVAEYPGAWVEGKLYGLTVHYRQVSANRIPDLESHVFDASSPFLDRMRLTYGPKAIEIVPELGWNKGTAVRFILEHLGQDNLLPFYAGDASNDDDAFESIAAGNGIGIGVGPDAAASAPYRAADPAELLAFLTLLDQSLMLAEFGGSKCASRASAISGLYPSFPSIGRM
jgi:trehalose 6-phosphate phosphatase